MAAAVAAAAILKEQTQVSKVNVRRRLSIATPDHNDSGVRNQNIQIFDMEIYMQKLQVLVIN
jgi:hypothetical protein